MPYQDSSYQDSSYQDSYSDGNGPLAPPEDPPFGPPLLWEAVLDDLSFFFDELGGPVTAHGGDQNSNYYDPADSAPLDSMWFEKFGWLPTVQNMPDAHYFDYLTSDVDPEFLLVSQGANHFVANFSHGQVDVQRLSDGQTYAFNVNGITVFGTWHAGGPGVQTPDAIEVTAGHWTFQFTGFDASHYNADPPPPPPIQDAAPSADVASAVANPEGVAEEHRQHLSTQIHQLLDQHGGHFIVTFKGPDGSDQSFDLADLVNVIDHFHIVATDEDYRAITGGAGRVDPDGHGGWVTHINRTQLIGYEIGAYNQLDFIILHEASHVLSIAQSYTHDQFTAWIAGGGTRETYTGHTGLDGSPALWRSESFSNNMAAAVEHHLGMHEPPAPLGGYDYSGLPH